MEGFNLKPRFKKLYFKNYITAIAINIYTELIKCFYIHLSIELLNHSFYADETTEI